MIFPKRVTITTMTDMAKKINMRDTEKILNQREEMILTQDRIGTIFQTLLKESTMQ